MESTAYGYVRVSTEEQNEARQIKALTKRGVVKKNITIEKTSGKTFNRTKYLQLYKRLLSGDTLYISSVDRLGRDYDGILEEWNKLTKEKKITIKVLETPILDTDNKADSLLDRVLRDITLLMLAFQAEQEWQNIKNRQAQGIAVAKEEGKHLGRPKAVHSKKQIQIIKAWKDGLLTLDEAMQATNKKKSAFYELVQKLNL